MKLGTLPLLEALCGEYLLGTLRGPARRRFERAVREEPRVAGALRDLQERYALKYTRAIAVEPSPNTWRRLERELDLAKYRTPWHRRVAFWRALAVASTAALALAIGVKTIVPVEKPPVMVTIARLEGKAQPQVTAALTEDRRTLELKADRPLVAGPSQSYELWLLPDSGGPPISLAVLGSLDTRVTLPADRTGGVRKGAKLAVSVEPAGGSPTGQPTGPVILVGEIAA